MAWKSNAPAAASVDQSGLVTAVGSGGAVITATSDGVSGSASVNVRGRAVIRLSRGAVTFTATRDADDPAPEEVDISNSGEASLLNLSASVEYLGGSSGWLSPSLSATAAPAHMTLTASVLGLPTGTHSARVVVASESASNSPQPVVVTFNVLEPPPVIGLNTQQVEMEAPEGSLTPVPVIVTVTNLGGAILTDLELDIEHTEGQPSGWLDADLDAPTAPTSIRLAAAAGTLVPGEYTATVLVSAPKAANSPLSVLVTFTVVPRAGVAQRATLDPEAVRSR